MLTEAIHEIIEEQNPIKLRHNLVTMCYNYFSTMAILDTIRNTIEENPDVVVARITEWYENVFKPSMFAYLIHNSKQLENVIKDLEIKSFEGGKVFTTDEIKKIMDGVDRS